ncbi:hypothetical protein PILCRDRAFT_828372 [Piloderma croceum F 1598]|uniref:Uncharacterized protein n=1 Tax=Piloderma croceum (strain F 1598) TaxID=765440 RepID=A0A0C3ENZ6_PILCF|nr:hypothetical protein PILCRDRAFT_828372 [Piloderma croceum F 1598]
MKTARHGIDAVCTFFVNATNNAAHVQKATHPTAKSVKAAQYMKTRINTTSPGPKPVCHSPMLIPIAIRMISGPQIPERHTPTKTEDEWSSDREALRRVLKR